MIEWKRICCAVDFSTPSRSALEEAAALARRWGADLTLLHVYAMPTTVSDAMLVAPPELFDQARVEVERKVDGWRAVAEEIAGRPVTATVRQGPAASEIVRFLQEGKFDLAVVATHGRTGLRHLVLGSVAERVVREAPCPVLVTRPPAKA